MISIILIVSISAIVIDARKYDDGLADLQKQQKDLDWTPQINKVFQGRDESELKQFAGTDKNKVNEAIKKGGQKQSKKPAKGQNGRRASPVSNSRWQDKNRYKPNYWEVGNNKPGKGQGKGEGKGGGKDKGRGNNRAFMAYEMDQKFDRGAENVRTKREVLPKNFDWRDYTSCESLSDIRYQQCGDCWSVASAAAISDRYCIYTGENRFFSAMDTTTCVYAPKTGCEGGDAMDAMNWYVNKGLPTGGDPSVTDEAPGCLPYPEDLNDNTKCPTRCVNGASFSVKKGGDAYSITSMNVTEIMHEIYWGGPCVAYLEIFNDFYFLGKGIYHRVNTTSFGGHSVRLIGWGVDNYGKAYWQCANQWGTDWGDNGYFRIRRGKNEAGIESYIVCSLPSEAYY